MTTNLFEYIMKSESADALMATNLYAHDPIGNRGTSVANTLTNQYQANALNQYASISNSQSPSLISLQYDPDGNLTNQGALSYVWEADKVTLLLVAAESRVAEALPKAREWTLAAKDTVLLKCAIHAVGVLGTQEDMEFLDAVRAQKDLKDVEVVWAKAREQRKKDAER